MNADLLAADVLAALDATGAGRSVARADRGDRPEAHDGAGAGARRRRSGCRRSPSGSPTPRTACRTSAQAAERVNGTLLLPGQTFSLNDTIVERTPANGYTKGFVIGPGGVFKEDLGGGVSTSATTIWTAAFYAGLQRVYTQAHSIWIPRYRAGLEATVAWGSFDMKFRNDTPHAVYVTTDHAEHVADRAMWGTKVYDEVRAVSSARYAVTPSPTRATTPRPPATRSRRQPGFRIDVYRVFVKAGKEVKREKITTRYRPSPHRGLQRRPASASPAPSTSGTTAPSGTPAATPTTTPARPRLGPRPTSGGPGPTPSA